LPTEAEWEYACRAGSATKYSHGNDEGLLGDYAWYDANSGKKTHPVGTKKPNSWGLYDMHGNVLEWVSDRYGDYPGGSIADPKGSSLGSLPVGRGSSWNEPAWFLGSANRAGYGMYSNWIGFRVVRQ